MTEAPAGRKIIVRQKLSAKASSECADAQDDFEEAA